MFIGSSAIRSLVGISVALCLSSCAGRQQTNDTSYTKTYAVPIPDPSPLIRTPIPSGNSITSTQINAHLPPDLTGANRRQVARIMGALPPGRRGNVRWTIDRLGRFVVYEKRGAGDCFADLVYAGSNNDVALGNTNVRYCIPTAEAHAFPGPVLLPSQVSRTHSP